MSSTINYIWYLFETKADYDNAEGSSTDPVTLDPLRIIFKDSVTHSFVNIGDHKDLIKDLRIHDPGSYAKIKDRNYLGLAINLKGTTKWQWVGKEVRKINSPYISLRIIDGKSSFDNGILPDLSGRDLYAHAIPASGIDISKIKIRDLVPTPNKEYTPQITDDGDGKFILTGISPTARLLVIYNGIIHTEVSLPYNRGGDSPDQINPPAEINFSSAATNHLHVILDASRFKPNTFSIKGRIIDGSATMSAKVNPKDSGKQINSASSGAVGISLTPADINTNLEVFKAGKQVTLKAAQVTLNSPMTGSFTIDRLYEGDDYVIVFDGVPHDDKRASVYNRGGSTSSDQPWDDVNRITLTRKNHENVVVDPRKQQECYSISGKIIEGDKANLAGIPYDITGEKLISKPVGKSLSASDKAKFKLNRSGAIFIPDPANIDVRSDGTFEIKKVLKDSYIVIFDGIEHTDSGKHGKSMYNRGGNSPTQNSDRVDPIDLIGDHINVIIDADCHEESGEIQGRIIDGNLASAAHIPKNASGKVIYGYNTNSINIPSADLDESKLKIKRRGTLDKKAVVIFDDKTKGKFTIKNVKLGPDIIVIYDDGTEHSHNDSSITYNRGGNPPDQSGSPTEIHLTDTVPYKYVIVDIKDFAATKSISGIVIDGDATQAKGVNPNSFASSLFTNGDVVRINPSTTPCSIHLAETGSGNIITGTIHNNGTFKFDAVGDGSYVVVVDYRGNHYSHINATRYNRGGHDPVTPSYLIIDDTTTKYDKVIVDISGIPPLTPPPPPTGPITVNATLVPVPVLKGRGSTLDVRVTSSVALPAGDIRISLDGSHHGPLRPGSTYHESNFGNRLDVGNHRLKAEYIVGGSVKSDFEIVFDVVDPAASGKKISLKLILPSGKPIPTDEYAVIANKPHRYQDKFADLLTPKLCKNNGADTWSTSQKLSIAFFKYTTKWIDSLWKIKKCTISNMSGGHILSIPAPELAISTARTSMSLQIINSLHDETLITLELEENTKVAPVATLDITILSDSKISPKSLKDAEVVFLAKMPMVSKGAIKLKDIESGSKLFSGNIDIGQYYVALKLVGYCDIPRPKMNVDGRNASASITSHGINANMIITHFDVVAGKNELIIKIDWQPLKLKYCVLAPNDQYRIKIRGLLKTKKAAIAFDHDQFSVATVKGKELQLLSKSKAEDAVISDAIYPGDTIYSLLRNVSNEIKIESVELDGKSLGSINDDLQTSVTNYKYKLEMQRPSSGNELMMVITLAPKEVKVKMKLKAYALFYPSGINVKNEVSNIKFEVDSKRKSSAGIKDLIDHQPIPVPRLYDTVYSGEKVLITMIPPGDIPSNLRIQNVAVVTEIPNDPSEIKWQTVKDGVEKSVQLIESDKPSQEKDHNINFILIKLKQVEPKATTSAPGTITLTIP